MALRFGSSLFHTRLRLVRWCLVLEREASSCMGYHFFVEAFRVFLKTLKTLKNGCRMLQRLNNAYWSELCVPERILIWGDCSHVLPSILNVHFSLCTLVYLYFCQLMKNVHVMYIVYFVNSQELLASSACKKASAADMDNHISSLIISMCNVHAQWRVWAAKLNLDSSGYNQAKSKQE